MPEEPQQHTWRRAYYCRQYGNFDALHGELLTEIERLSDALGTAWDDGNATGLDGWTGPGRGTLPIDDQAVRNRDRCLDSIRGAEPTGLTAEVEQLRAENARLQALLDYPLSAEADPWTTRLRSISDPAEAFDAFIRAWVTPVWQGHLLDDDENDGQRIRDLITGAQP